MMMQMAESRIQKNNLSSAMDRFMGAVNDMDQTVMLPSMLRDLPMDEDCSDASDPTGHAPKSNVDVVDGDGDMYSYYQLLKSMRRDMEWGVGGGWRTTTTTAAPGRTPPTTCDRRVRSRLTRKDSSGSLSSASSVASEESEESEDEDLEKRFQYHLTGLQGVLSKLTRQAVCLTDRYKQELRIGEKTTPNCLW